jgi:2-oxoglutarate dehydrogenase E1 component
MQMNQLRNYKTGGLLHVIANNQIGFTTTPKDSRSTPHCTDLGKAMDAPILHVNADDPEAVEFAFQMAAKYFRKYPKDMIVDVVGYRRHGHNEQDEPKFTQPEMYSIIDKHKIVSDIYEERLISEGIDKNVLDKIKKDIDDELNRYFDQAKAEDTIHYDHLEDEKYDYWTGFSTDKYNPSLPTGINIETLKGLGEKINTIPSDFNIHPRVKKIYEARMQSIKEGKGIDWATGEALAWAVLLQQGNVVRISGQDVERGTFSHRHSVLHDQVDFTKTIRPLNNSTNNPGNLQIALSPLSEFSVLGFELGFSYYNPSALVMWESQFGDFANGAQVIIDQFIASGESKWDISSGLVLMLPHGMDGMGPEHSSCRIERFLELSEDHPEKFDYKQSDTFNINNNIQVCNPTTPANYFHVLLRQISRSYRKPLIIPTPKRLLRLKQASSNLVDFSQGKSFQKVRKEADESVLSNSKNVTQILICSGNVYYDLIAEREKIKNKDTAIITLEQVAPTPYNQIAEAISQFPNASVKWVQEEHMNAGCWAYVQPRLNSVNFFIHIFIIFF